MCYNIRLFNVIYDEIFLHKFIKKSFSYIKEDSFVIDHLNSILELITL